MGDTFLSSLHPFTSVDIYLCMCLLQVVWSVAVGDTFLPTLLLSHLLIFTCVCVCCRSFGVLLWEIFTCVCVCCRSFGVLLWEIFTCVCVCCRSFGVLLWEIFTCVCVCCRSFGVLLWEIFTCVCVFVAGRLECCCGRYLPVCVFVAGRLECCYGRYLPVCVFVAGRLECCCGRYFPWATCRTRDVLTRKWSTSLRPADDWTHRSAVHPRCKPSRSSDKLTSGVITPNKVPLTTIVTYLQKGYRSRISNHWASIPACSVVPPIYKQSKKTYCHVSF